MTVLKIDLTALASVLFHGYSAVAHPELARMVAHPELARTPAYARFQGVCVGISALGLDGNEYTVMMAVQRVCDRLGPIPPVDPFAPGAWADYRDAAIPEIVAELEELIPLDMAMPGWREALDARDAQRDSG